MILLREKVRQLIHDDEYFGGPDEAEYALADAILDLPEIKEALRHHNAYFTFYDNGKRVVRP